MKGSLGETKILENYFGDLYALFMKRLSQFAIESYTTDVETGRLQKMLAELLKVKKILNRKIPAEFDSEK